MGGGEDQPAKGDLCWRTVSPRHAHAVHVHTCKHGPTRSHLPNSRELRTCGIEERVRVQECPPPEPHPPGKDAGSPAKAPALRTRVGPSPGRKETGCSTGRLSGGKGAGPACHCSQQSCVHSTASGGPGPESTPCPTGRNLHRGARTGMTDHLGFGPHSPAVQARSLHRT